MKVFLAGAVSSADSKQLAKYGVYKNCVLDTLGNIDLTVPDDIWDYRNDCIKYNPDFTKLDVDKAMVKYDLDLVRQADLIICDLSQQSNGMGIELGVACSNNIEVIFFYEAGAYVSNMVTGAFSDSKFIEYKDLDELKNKLAFELKKRF